MKTPKSIKYFANFLCFIKNIATKQQKNIEAVKSASTIIGLFVHLIRTSVF